MTDAMTEKLVKFDAFGLIKLKYDEVSVTITAITDKKKAIVREVTVELDQPPEGFEEFMFLMGIFGVEIEESGKTRVMFNDIGAIEGYPKIGDVPEAGKAVAKAMDMVKRAIS